MNLRFKKILEKILEEEKIPFELFSKEEEEIRLYANKVVDAILKFKEKLLSSKMKVSEVK
ncbi:MAG: hypothetical protein QW589_04295 [Candidatus Bathyarchaeia archaeon]